MRVYCDFETRSVADLREVGLYNYARHPTTDVWCLCYAVDDGPVRTWRPGDPIPVWTVLDYEVVAHNAAFELAIWEHVMVPRYGAPPIAPERATCTMARAYAMGLPGSLEDAAYALGLAATKDKVGRALMLRMCRPRRMENGAPVWWEDPEKIERLIAYCATDVEVERQLYDKLMPLGESERRVWLMDQRINARGIGIDRPSVKAAIAAVADAKHMLDTEMYEMTGGAVPSCSALGALKAWCATKGVVVDGLAKADVRAWLDALAGSHNPNAAEVTRALLLRQEAGKASTAKLQVMLDAAGPDGRVRNMFQYHGAATGRWAGRMIQPHNFPRDVPKQKVVERWLEMLRNGETRELDAIYAPVMNIISRCLRGFLVPAPGNVYVVSDFSNVEGRGVAWFAGEDWKLRAFREADAGTGPGLYELAYAKSFDVPVESVANPSWERQVGKVMELAFGYGGGVGAFKTMGAVYGVSVPDSKADEFKQNWRRAHPAVRSVWRDLERAAILAVQNPGRPYRAGHPQRPVTFKMVGSFLWCQLPSGRVLAYADPKLIEGAYGPQLTYFTVPSTNDLKRGSLIDDPRNTNKWARVSTYGGSLLENVIQAVCRDLLKDAMEQLEALGYAVVLHVHDEIVIEVPAERAEQARADMHRIMNTAPLWAAGFPLAAGCDVMGRYGKP